MKGDGEPFCSFLHSISGDDIDASQPEMGCGCEEVAIIGINFRKAMFRRASKVEGIGGAEEGRRWCGLKSFF